MHLRRALALDPSRSLSWNSLGVVYAAAGRLDSARVCWVRALQLDPANADARRNLQRLSSPP